MANEILAKGKPEMQMNESIDKINLLSARIRVGEERNSEIRKKLLFIEQNMMTNHKKAMAEIKSLKDEMNELKRTIKNIEDKIITIIKELRLTSKKEDIEVMKKYIEIWNPINFVTRDQVDKIIAEQFKQTERPPRYDSP